MKCMIKSIQQAIKQSLALFLISLMFLSFSLATSSKMEALTKMPLRGYYFIQRLYPGGDALDQLKESEFHTNHRYFEVNDEIIFFTKNPEKLEDVEDSINLIDLLDPKLDQASEGKCCSRISYNEYPGVKGLRAIIPAIPSTLHGKKAVAAAKAAIQAVKSTNNAKSCASMKFKEVSSKITINESKEEKPKTSSLDTMRFKQAMNTPSLSKNQEKMKKNPKDSSNICLTLWVPDEARWRICSDEKDKIAKLQMKIVYAILKQSNGKNTKVIEKFIENFQVGSEELPHHWDWLNQDKWRGKCPSTSFQSPIDIKTPTVEKIVNANLSMKFADVHMVIKKNYDELIVGFLNMAGVLKISVEGTYLLFTPQYMSFRFPGEHLFDGERADGEILIHFQEISTQRVII